MPPADCLCGVWQEEESQHYVAAKTDPLAPYGVDPVLNPATELANLQASVGDYYNESTASMEVRVHVMGTTTHRV
jgi:hypothetical protein